MLNGERGLITTPVLDGNHSHYHPRVVQHQHSDPHAIHQHAHNQSFRSERSSQDPSTPPATSSDARFRRNSHDFDIARSTFEAGSTHEILALRKHLKVLEDRLRGERHTHAVKFSEIEKSLIQENAKLKVTNAALERQLRRDEHRIAELEADLSKMRKQEKEKKSGRFSLSGVTRSFSDAKLDDMEMKSSTLTKRNTDSEVVAVIKQRLSDCEKDRLEAESQFTQRISTLLKERNIERADFRAAEETIMRLTGEVSALSQTVDDLRNAGSNSTPPSNQVPLLRRANQQLQEELDQLNLEKSKLLIELENLSEELENLSEELALSRANELQSLEQASLFDGMKNKIDSLRVKMASMERKQVPQQMNESVTSGSGIENQRKDLEMALKEKQNEFQNQRKIADLEMALKQKQYELTDCHRKLVTILELSQRYEHHCYNLEKELSQFYGKAYKFVQTDWRKRDAIFMKTISSSVKPSTEVRIESHQRQFSTASQTVNFPVHFSVSETQNQDGLPGQSGLLSKLNQIIGDLGSSHGLESRYFESISGALNHLSILVRDENESTNAKEEEMRKSLKLLEQTNRTLEQTNRSLEEQLRLVLQNQEDDGIDAGPISQLEIDEKILAARMEAAKLSSFEKRQDGILDALAKDMIGSPLTNYTSSGVFTSAWSSGSSSHENGRPRSASFY